MFQLVSAAGNQNQGSSNNFLCASILHGLPWNNNFVPYVSKPNLYVGCHVCSHCPDQLTSGLLCSVDIQQGTRVKQAHGLIRLLLLYKPCLQPLGLVHCISSILLREARPHVWSSLFGSHRTAFSELAIRSPFWQSVELVNAHIHLRVAGWS